MAQTRAGKRSGKRIKAEKWPKPEREQGPKGSGPPSPPKHLVPVLIFSIDIRFRAPRVLWLQRRAWFSLEYSGKTSFFSKKCSGRSLFPLFYKVLGLFWCLFIYFTMVLGLLWGELGGVEVGKGEGESGGGRI